MSLHFFENDVHLLNIGFKLQDSVANDNCKRFVVGSNIGDVFSPDLIAYRSFFATFKLMTNINYKQGVQVDNTTIT